jgi:hypothetical protein
MTVETSTAYLSFSLSELSQSSEVFPYLFW